MNINFTRKKNLQSKISKMLPLIIYGHCVEEDKDYVSERVKTFFPSSSTSTTKVIGGLMMASSFFFIYVAGARVDEHLR